ncbi:G-protein coupled receptor family C group 6 member A-like [Stegastes partitus]|nr:PREDICTED: G-protein coupled receptor family C group 6 member A-like [Stegastes partitus]
MFHLHVSTMFLVWIFVCITSVFHSCLGENSHLHDSSPGDIIIGGLFPIHLKTNRTTVHGAPTCTDYDFEMFLRAHVMIHAIKEVNLRGILPNLTIGYDIYDTCGDVSIAIKTALQLLKNQSDPQSCSLPKNDLPEPKTKVVIGERYSEMSVAVARIFALSSVAQISYASTSELLSKKYKFPTFLRTVPSDAYQTDAIVQLVLACNWKTVAIVGSDDEYGKYGSDRLEDLFNNETVCIEFIKILPGDFHRNSSLLPDLVKKIRNSSAEAIILFTRDAYVKIIMEEAIKCRLNRTWIASDSWSTSSLISEMPDIGLAGQVYGFIFKRNEVPGFNDYVSSVFNGTTNSFINHSLTNPLCLNQSVENQKKNCSQTKSQQCLHPSCLADYIDQGESYSIYLAVQVIADGLRRLLKCDNQRCKRGPKFTALELLMEIKKVNCTIDTTHIFFNSEGDPSLGYDIVYWNMSESMQLSQIETIGEYLPDRPNGTITIPDDLRSKMENVTVSVYNCSKKCEPGHELKTHAKKCCFDCVRCASGEFSPKNGQPCKRCGENQYSLSEKRDQCLNKTDEYLLWSDPFSIILNFLACVGIVATVGFTVLFAIYYSTPIVKAVGGYLCFLELFSLLASFCLSFSFVGKPTKVSCFLGMPFFFMAFSVCISCILANLLQILVGFTFDLNVGSWIKKLNRPLAVVTIVSGVQLVLSVSWLAIQPPTPDKDMSEKTIVHQCEIRFNGFILAMAAYQALLGFICFTFAFKSKQLPDLYKNAVLITVSMLLVLIIWIVFTPLYLTLTGKYKPAIESAAILISSYSVLGCHLAPKCYIMVFRKELNNESAITECIRKHYEQKGIAVVKS